MKSRKFKVTLLVDGKEKDSAVAHSWTAFLNGKWVQEVPTRPGKYMVILGKARNPGEDLDYHRGGELGVAAREGAFCKLKELPEKAWWWSVRMPRELPRVIPLEPKEKASKKPALKLVVNNK